jgi:putative spermidine/putrescine transport system permease protein
MWLKVYVTIVLVALVAPILVVIQLSFTSSNFFFLPPPSYSLTWYNSFLENPVWIESLLRSLNVALWTVLVSTILGTMASVAVTHLNFWGKKAFMSLMVAPMIIPVIIIGIALYNSFAKLQLNNSLTGLVLAHSILAIPFVFVAMTTSLKGVDRNLEMAAMGLGSTPVGAFFKVTLPLIKPAVLSGCLFAFITSLDEVVVTIFISGATSKTLPIVMWENLRTQVDPTIAAVSSIIIVGTIILFLLLAWATSRTSRFRENR